MVHTTSTYVVLQIFSTGISRKKKEVTIGDYAHDFEYLWPHYIRMKFSCIKCRDKKSKAKAKNETLLKQVQIRYFINIGLNNEIRDKETKNFGPIV